MSGRAPLWVLSVPVLSVLAICLYLRHRRSSDPPDTPGGGTADTEQPPASADADTQEMVETVPKTLAVEQVATAEHAPVVEVAVQEWGPEAESTGDHAGGGLSHATSQTAPIDAVVPTGAGSYSENTPNKDTTDAVLQTTEASNPPEAAASADNAVVVDTFKYSDAMANPSTQSTAEDKTSTVNVSKYAGTDSAAVTETRAHSTEVSEPKRRVSADSAAVTETPAHSTEVSEPKCRVSTDSAAVTETPAHSTEVSEPKCRVSTDSAAVTETPAHSTEVSEPKCRVSTDSAAVTETPAHSAEVFEPKRRVSGEQKDACVEEKVITAQIISVMSTAKAASEEPTCESSAEAACAEPLAGGDSILAQLKAAMAVVAAPRPVEPDQEQKQTPGQPEAWADQPESAQDAAAAGDTAAAAQPEADVTSENSSDSGKGGSSVSLEQASPSTTEASVPTLYDFLIPQKLCGRLIGKNGTFVNMLKSRTGASVFIRVHPVKTAVKICTVEGTQSEIDACLELIREKFPVQKFPAMTLERLARSQEPLSVPVSQQLHLPQSVTCDVIVSAIVCPGQMFLQQHTHPTFRGLERLNMLMTACYGGPETIPQLPRPVPPSSVCAAPVLDGWYRAQVVAYNPDTDQVDVRFLDYGGYSRLAAADIRQIRTDFMSLPFQAEECYLANVLPTNDEGWSQEESAVFESLICDLALEAMVVGYAEDGVPFVNLYSIQRTTSGAPAVSLVNQQLVESGAARWVENQA